MKRSDLFREYARVIDMCEGTNIEPWKCVKNGRFKLNSTPTFNATPDSYTFALAIVEDKPVFVGNVLYGPNMREFIILDRVNNDYLYVKGIVTPIPIGHFTWTKPDPFAELLKAQAEGKRIVFNDGAKWIDTDGIDTVNFKPENYKVVDHDVSVIHEAWYSDFKARVRAKFTKCGITGKIRAEVIE